jgi:hypothetical protein
MLSGSVTPRSRRRVGRFHFVFEKFLRSVPIFILSSVRASFNLPQVISQFPDTLL